MIDIEKEITGYKDVVYSALEKIKGMYPDSDYEIIEKAFNDFYKETAKDLRELAKSIAK